MLERVGSQEKIVGTGLKTETKSLRSTEYVGLKNGKLGENQFLDGTTTPVRNVTKAVSI